MRRIILTTAFIGLTAIAYCQFGFQAGVTFAKYKAKGGGLTISSDSKTGFTAGVVNTIPISSSLSLRPELNFVQKGGKIDQSESGYVSTAEETLNYIEVPINLVYSHESAGGGKVFLGGGPSIGFGISGKNKYKESNGLGGVDEGSSDVKFGGDENKDDYKALDFGLNLLAGYQLKSGLFFDVAYTIGLSNYSHDSDFDQKNSVFTIRVGFMLPGMKKASK